MPSQSSLPVRPRVDLFLLAVLLAAVAGAGWWAYAGQQQLLFELSDRVAVNSAALQELRNTGAALTRLEVTVQALASDIERERVRAQLAREDLARAVAESDAREPGRDRNFVLAETEFLVLQAVDRLRLDQNVAGARIALSAARDRLKAANDPRFLSLTERVSTDLAALDRVDAVDLSALALQISDLIGAVEALPLRPLQSPGADGRTNAADTADRERSLAGRIWADLLSLVEIRDMQAYDRWLLDTELPAVLRQHLRLELQNARFAILRRDAPNLRASLGQAVSLLDGYFDLTARPVMDFRRRLQAMQDVVLSPPLPDLVPTLEAVRGRRMPPQDQDGGL